MDKNKRGIKFQQINQETFHDHQRIDSKSNIFPESTYEIEYYIQNLKRQVFYKIEESETVRMLPQFVSSKIIGISQRIALNEQIIHDTCDSQIFKSEETEPIQLQRESLLVGLTPIEHYCQNKKVQKKINIDFKILEDLDKMRKIKLFQINEGQSKLNIKARSLSPRTRNQNDSLNKKDLNSIDQTQQFEKKEISIIQKLKSTIESNYQKITGDFDDDIDQLNEFKQLDSIQNTIFDVKKRLNSSGYVRKIIINQKIKRVFEKSFDNINDFEDMDQPDQIEEKINQNQKNSYLKMIHSRSLQKLHPLDLTQELPELKLKQLKQFFGKNNSPKRQQTAKSLEQKQEEIKKYKNQLEVNYQNYKENKEEIKKQLSERSNLHKCMNDFEIKKSETQRDPLKKIITFTRKKRSPDKREGNDEVQDIIREQKPFQNNKQNFLPILEQNAIRAYVYNKI